MKESERNAIFGKLSEMNNFFVGLTLTLNIIKNVINELEDKSLEITQK